MLGVDINSLIQLLQSSDLYAECECGEEFKLSEFKMFDGTKVLPKEVKPYGLAMEDQLKEMKEGNIN